MIALIPAALWILFLLRLPFGEGSGSPGGLLVAHLLFLATIAASGPPGRPGRPPSARLALPALAAAYLLLSFWALIAAAPGSISVETGPFRWVDRPWVRLALGGALLSASLLQASRGALVGLAAGGGVFGILWLPKITKQARR